MAQFNSVCVFLGSSTGNNAANSEATIAMGNALVRRGITLVYGGGAVGLMGLLADTVVEGGGDVVGIIPRNLFGREVAHRGLTELIETENMHERKALMYERSDAFAALPGGMGTLDELAEISTWRQIGLHNKPVGVVDTNGYYQYLLKWLDQVTADALMSSNSRSLLISAPTPDDLLDALAADEIEPQPKWDS